MDRFQLLQGDCRDLLPALVDQSIDLVITDPPYFIDGFDSSWSDSSLKCKSSKAGVVGSLPVGMKFDRKQGEYLQSFISPIANQLFRILKPGAFCIVFSQPRLYHRMAMCFDLAGFEIRDMLVWKNERQPKAFSQSHFIKRRNDLSIEQKEQLISELSNRKTPQLRPQIEPMVLAQKPKSGTFVQNWIDYRLGLVDISQTLDGKFPGNLIELSNTSRSNIDHFTVKPTPLISHLIKLFSSENQTVLDPFLGSGTTLLSAVETNRKFIGFELEEKYLQIAEKRLSDFLSDK